MATRSPVMLRLSSVVMKTERWSSPKRGRSVAPLSGECILARKPIKQLRQERFPSSTYAPSRATSDTETEPQIPNPIPTALAPVCPCGHPLGVHVCGKVRLPTLMQQNQLARRVLRWSFFRPCPVPRGYRRILLPESAFAAEPKWGFLPPL